jgi:hypothetical protein
MAKRLASVTMSTLRVRLLAHAKRRLNQWLRALVGELS